MSMAIKQYNPLQVPTWSWLHINHAAFEQDGMPRSFLKTPTVQAPQGVLVENRFAEVPLSQFPQALRLNYSFAVEHCSSALSITLPKGFQSDEPILIDYTLTEAYTGLVDCIAIHAEAGSRATIAIQYTGANASHALHFGCTVLKVDESAHVKLVKAQLLPADATHVDALAVTVQANATADVMLSEAGAGHIVAGCNIDLSACQSKASLGGLYVGHSDQQLDFNYRIALNAPDVEGEIRVNGALAGSAHKIMRSTLDFLPGALNAKGRETETVLTLSKQVVNVSAPLLLCGEENVEGQHATSTGRPDAGKLNYLMNRGFDRRQAERMLVAASFAPLYQRIDPPALRETIQNHVGDVIHGA